MLNKEIITQDIINCANIYSRDVAGKEYLFVFEKEYFELIFLTNRFSHLTGVSSPLSAQLFFELAKKKWLNKKQFYFSKKKKQSIVNAKHKLDCLKRISELTNSQVFVFKGLQTLKVYYKLGVTNIDFSLALVRDKEKQYYHPQSLRVKDKSIEKCKEVKFIDFIFCKNPFSKKYSQIMFADNNKMIPKNVMNLIKSSLLKRYKKNKKNEILKRGIYK